MRQTIKLHGDARSTRLARIRALARQAFDANQYHLAAKLSHAAEALSSGHRARSDRRLAVALSMIGRAP